MKNHPYSVLSCWTSPYCRVFGLPFTAAVLGLCLLAPDAQAATISQNAPIGTSYDGHVHGQSTTTLAGGPWNEIQFNFYDNTPEEISPAGYTPVAAGNLFILSSEYLGAPGNLSSATTGFVAQSTGITAGVYQFDSAVTLAGETRYWFYTDAEFNRVNGTSLPEETGYYILGGEMDYAPSGKGYDFAFLLQGVVDVPEPTTAAILSLSLGALSLRRRRR